jgi:hypothetical protein
LVREQPFNFKGKEGEWCFVFKNYVTTFNRTTNFLEDAPKKNNIVMWLNMNLSNPT